MTEALLRSSGHKTGLFTSPHLIEARERIRINGAPISQEMFAKYFWMCWYVKSDVFLISVPVPVRVVWMWFCISCLSSSSSSCFLVSYIYKYFSLLLWLCLCFFNGVYTCDISESLPTCMYVWICLLVCGCGYVYASMCCQGIAEKKSEHQSFV